jgi:hypothetical protein
LSSMQWVPHTLHDKLQFERMNLGEMVHSPVAANSGHFSRRSMHLGASGGEKMASMKASGLVCHWYMTALATAAMHGQAQLRIRFVRLYVGFCSKDTFRVAMPPVYEISGPHSRPEPLPGADAVPTRRAACSRLVTSTLGSGCDLKCQDPTLGSFLSRLDSAW